MIAVYAKPGLLPEAYSCAQKYSLGTALSLLLSPSPRYSEVPLEFLAVDDSSAVMGGKLTVQR